MRNLGLAAAAVVIAAGRWTDVLADYAASTGLVTLVALGVGALGLDTYLTVRRARRGT